MKLLEGEDIRPKNTKQAKALIGETVEFLREKDIDRSGRGYFFPRVSVIEDAFRGHVVLSGDPTPIREIREMVISCDDQS